MVAAAHRRRARRRAIVDVALGVQRLHHGADEVVQSAPREHRGAASPTVPCWSAIASWRSRAVPATSACREPVTLRASQSSAGVGGDLVGSCCSRAPVRGRRRGIAYCMPSCRATWLSGGAEASDGARALCARRTLRAWQATSSSWKRRRRPRPRWLLTAARRWGCPLGCA